MKLTSIRSLFICAALAVGVSAHAQNVKLSNVTSSISIAMKTLGAINLYSMNLSVSYPVGLSPASYITGTQLNADFAGFVSSYPNPQDPPEAILGTVLTSILAKYPQMNLGSIVAITASVTTIGGTSIPSPGNSISVEIGTYGTVSSSAQISSSLRR